MPHRGIYSYGYEAWTHFGPGLEVCSDSSNHALPSQDPSRDNGAAAHLAQPGDKVILATFAEVEPEQAKDWKPTVVLCDDDNGIVDGDHAELAGPKRRLNAL